MTETVLAKLESLHSRLERLERQAHLGMFHSASVLNEVTDKNMLNSIAKFNNVARGFSFEVRNERDNLWIVQCM
jgi:hypothetical protein